MTAKKPLDTSTFKKIAAKHYLYKGYELKQFDAYLWGIRKENEGDWDKSYEKRWNAKEQVDRLQKRTEPVDELSALKNRSIFGKIKWAITGN